MRKETEAQRRAKLKYRKNNTHSLVIAFPNAEYAKIYTYCKYINSPVATFVRKTIHQVIDSDPTFTYTSEEESQNED